MAAFGRFDVYYPDGRIETWSLEGADISVGRAADNTITLSTDTISRHHFSLNYKNGIVQLTDLDSANGTYVDGRRLKGKTPHLLDDVEEIQIGHLRIIYYPKADSPTLPIRPIDDSTQPTQANFRASLEAAQVDVWPASSRSVEIVLTNHRETAARYQIALSGLPEGWAKINRPLVSLDGQETSVILLHIKPARRADMEPASYPVTIHITPIHAPDQSIQLGLMVRVRGFGGLSLALNPPVVRSQDSLHLYLLNQGSEALTLAVKGYDPKAQLQFELPRGTIQLSAGQRTQITGKVQARQSALVGKAAAIPFALLVQAHTESAGIAAVPGTLLAEPRLRASRLIPMVGMVAVLLLILTLALSRTPQPKITSLTLSDAQVAQGTPVALHWQASAAQRYVIEVNRNAVADLVASETTWTLETRDYDGPVDIALIAVHHELVDIETRRLTVYEPVSIKMFAADRQTMVRRVSAALAVRWLVEGAVSVTIRPPVGFRTSDASEEDDAMVMQGAPQEDFDIVLFAQDEIGTVVERSIRITTIEPECTPTQDTPLYEGPHSRFPQTEVAVRDVPVLAGGITGNRDWLKVELASGETAWGSRASFACVGFDPDALNVIEDVPRLPTATPSMTPPPASLPTATDSSTPPMTEPPGRL